MKTKIFIFSCLVAALGFTACNDNNGSENSSTIEASKKSNIKQGEPVVFKVSVPDSSSLSWSVTPSQNVKYSTSGKSASFVFSAKGTYNIEATAGGGFKAALKVSVTDSIYHPQTTVSDKTISLSGDVISIKPSVVDSVGVKGLALLAETKKSYDGLQNYLITTTDYVNGNISVTFGGVCIPSNSETGSKTAVSYFGFYPVTIGTHPVKMIVNGNTYTGSLNYTGTAFTFSWTNTSEIVISPLTVQ